MSNGKGDRPRPSSVSREAYAASYARIFRRPMLEDAPAPVEDLAVDQIPDFLKALAGGSRDDAQLPRAAQRRRFG